MYIYYHNENLGKRHILGCTLSASHHWPTISFTGDMV